MPLGRRVVAACLAAGLGLGVAGVGAFTTAPAYADSAANRLRAAQQRADRLDAQAHRQAAEVSTLKVRLATLDAQANAALESYQQANAYADKTHAAAAASLAALDLARARTAAARTRVGSFAADAYRSQATGGAIATTFALVETGNPQAFLDGINVLSQVGQAESDALDDVRVAQGAQDRATGAADAAANQAAQAAAGALTAKRNADALVAEQQSAVSDEQKLLAKTKSAATTAHARATALARAIAVARARAEAIRRAEAAAAAGAPVALCHGGDLSGYANGQLPVADLCPLWQAPGEMLTQAAAAAFNQMSHAYAAAFGVPLCVTASYRTYQRQVELYATMPAGYAAVPGTSNHGWAIAADLCGGIQVDGSPEHLWLLDHAAQFDWFHPAWAMPGGAGPYEPWHWEYAG